MPDTKKLYSIFRGLNKGSFESGEGWKIEDNEQENFKFVRLETPGIELPEPISHLSYSFLRTGTTFGLFGNLVAREKRVFEGLSEMLTKRFLGEGRLFIQTTKSGTGYFFRDFDSNRTGNTPDAVLMDVNSGKNRIISRGSLGARNLSFLDEEDFTIQVGLFNNYINLILSSIYESHNPRVSIGSLPKIVLAFPPI